VAAALQPLSIDPRTPARDAHLEPAAGGARCGGLGEPDKRERVHRAWKPAADAPRRVCSAGLGNLGSRLQRPARRCTLVDRCEAAGPTDPGGHEAGHALARDRDRVKTDLVEAGPPGRGKRGQLSRGDRHGRAGDRLGCDWARTSAGGSHSALEAIQELTRNLSEAESLRERIDGIERTPTPSAQATLRLAELAAPDSPRRPPHRRQATSGDR